MIGCVAGYLINGFLEKIIFWLATRVQLMIFSLDLRLTLIVKSNNSLSILLCSFVSHCSNFDGSQSCMTRLVQISNKSI